MDPRAQFQSEEFQRYSKECRRIAALVRPSKQKAPRPVTTWQDYISRIRQALPLPASVPAGLRSARG